MRSRFPLSLAVCALVAVPTFGGGQSPGKLPERAVRRDMPLTDMIRRAFAAGTRDSSGRPGPKYWQAWTDYTISARFDPATGLITGHERVVVQNNSDSALSRIVLRLDQNIFSANVPRAEVVTQITDGVS